MADDHFCMPCCFAGIFFADMAFIKIRGKDILDIAEIAGGRILKLSPDLYLEERWHLWRHHDAEIFRRFKDHIFTQSPLSYIMFFFMAGMVIAGFLGIESIVRHTAIVTPIIIAGYVLILLGTIPKADLTNLTPLFGTGLRNIMWKGLYRTSIFAELLVLFMLPPFLDSYKEVRNIGFTAIGLSSLFLTAGSLTYILDFPYPSSLEPFLPVFNMARHIGAGRFFQRIESMFDFIWAMSALLYLATVFFFSVYTVSKAAGLKYSRPMIIPFAIIVFSAAFLPPDLMSVISIESNIINIWGWAVAFAFLGLIILWARLVKHGKREMKGK